MFSHGFLRRSLGSLEIALEVEDITSLTKYSDGVRNSGWRSWRQKRDIHPFYYLQFLLFSLFFHTCSSSLYFAIAHLSFYKMHVVSAVDITCVIIKHNQITKCINRAGRTDGVVREKRYRERGKETTQMNKYIVNLCNYHKIYWSMTHHKQTSKTRQSCITRNFITTTFVTRVLVIFRRCHFSSMLWY